MRRDRGDQKQWGIVQLAYRADEQLSSLPGPPFLLFQEERKTVYLFCQVLEGARRAFQEPTKLLLP